MNAFFPISGHDIRARGRGHRGGKRSARTAVYGNSPLIETITIVDRNMLRTMLREIAGGGKFFKKIAIPRLVIPIIAKIEPILRSAQERGDLRHDLDRCTPFCRSSGG